MAAASVSRQLNVVVMPDWPYVYRAADYYPDGHNQLGENITIDGWSGIGIDLLAQLGKAIAGPGFNDTSQLFRLFTPPDMQWGELQDNGSWNGLCGVLLRKEADVGLALLDLNQDRIPLFRTLRLPVSNYKTIWISENNLERPARHLWTLVRLLDKETWLSALACLVACIIIIRLIRHVLKLTPVPMAELRIFGAALGQWEYGTNSMAEQFVFVALLLSMMLFTLTFSTSLIAEFTVDKRVLPFETTREMYEKGYKIANIDESLSDLRLFEQSPNSWENALYESRPTQDEFYLNATFFHQEFQNYSSVDNHIMKRSGAKYGLILGHTPLTNPQYKCNHPWIPAVVEAFSNPHAILAFRHDDVSLFNQFDHYYRLWEHHGLVRAAINRAEYGVSNLSIVLRCSNAHYISRIWKHRLESSFAGANGNKIQIETIQSPLILLAFGYFVGGFTLAVEFMVIKLRNTDRQKQHNLRSFNNDSASRKELT